VIVEYPEAVVVVEKIVVEVEVEVGTVDPMGARRVFASSEVAPR
jgi:hypothetical protein